MTLSDAPPSRALASEMDCGGCGPGTCVEPAEGNKNVETSTLGSIPSCDCKDTGFVGEHCEVACARDCLNGGKCVPADDSNGGEETCSCSKAVVAGNPYAGLDCEYGATKSCMTLGSGSKHSFCTNGGECADIVGDNEMHYDCICESGFEGPHCEYVVGTMPANIARASSGAGDGGVAFQSESTSDVIVWSMIVVVAAIIGALLLAFGVRAKRRRAEAKRREREVREATEELAMMPTDDDPEKEII